MTKLVTIGVTHVLRASMIAGALSLLGGCSGKVRDDTARSAGESGSTGGGAGGASGDEKGGAKSGTGGTSLVGTGGTSSVGTGGTSSVGTGGASAGAGGSGCDGLRNTANNALSALLDGAANSCVSDDDCTYTNVPDCLFGCGSPIVSSSGLPKVQAGYAMVDQLCAQFRMQGCVALPPPCPYIPGAPACVEDRCELFVPKKWVSVTFLETSSSGTISLDCHDCKKWTVTPDGRIQTSFGDTTAFDAAETQRANEIIESVPFRKAVMGPGVNSECSPPDSNEAIMLYRMTSDSEQYMNDVTSCIQKGPPDNAPLALWKMIQSNLSPDGG